MKINPSTKNATHNLPKLIRNIKWFCKFGEARDCLVVVMMAYQTKCESDKKPKIQRIKLANFMCAPKMCVILNRDAVRFLFLCPIVVLAWPRFVLVFVQTGENSECMQTNETLTALINPDDTFNDSFEVSRFVSSVA